MDLDTSVSSIEGSLLEAGAKFATVAASAEVMLSIDGLDLSPAELFSGGINFLIVSYFSRLAR